MSQRHNSFSPRSLPTLPSSNVPVIEISLVKGTFQDSLATLLNVLLANVRCCPDLHTLKINCFTILKSRVSLHLS